MNKLRRATGDDIPGMHRVRLSVRENKLTTTVISESDYGPAIELPGRGWVVESGSSIVGFAIGNQETGQLWALFVHPNYENMGYGAQLHDTAVNWLFANGKERLWLTTEPGTRAQRFYELKGWEVTGHTKHGEIRFELSRPTE